MAATLALFHPREGNAQFKTAETSPPSEASNARAYQAPGSDSARARPPARIPFRNGESYPGYHVGELPRTGFLIGGAVGWGAVYLLQSYVAIQARRPLLFIPIAGPWIELSYDRASPQGQIVFTADGIAQLVLVGVFASGFLFPKKYFIRDDEANGRSIEMSRWIVLPRVYGGSTPGLGIYATW